MGDYFQIIVDRDVTADDAPRLAARIRDWLVERRIIEPELTDCTLGSLGHRPGSGYADSVKEFSPNSLGLWTNGLAIETGRTVFHSIDVELTCRACGARVEPGDDWMEAVDAWYGGDDAVVFKCPRCGVPERLVDWDGEFPWGFGNLGFTFWNWTVLSDRFIQEMTEQLGHRTILVRGKL